ncbi:iron-containing redox enzyme family protein [Archangium violaceum]|uniref:iron-containing redox enzyme family protein n=1 Tax=Archangium violaceum TaxID=83451 RepID=UPI002B30E351|nr:iron-containing redox enzyme family protein [Archangium violaceum]
MRNVKEFISNLAESVFSHEALNNNFYTAWMAGPLDLPRVEIFARNYLVRTNNTSTMVALSFLSTADVLARVEIVKNLHSEFGYGNPAKAHIVLLEGFLTQLLSRLAGRSYQLSELERLPILPTTSQFVVEQRQLYTHSNERMVLGTLLAQEWLAYSMLTRLYEGARNYRHLFRTLDEFHENCEYFYVHIGEAEKDHKEQAIVSANRVCRTDEELAELKSGFDKFLGITAAFWRGIHEEMSKVRTAA